MEPGCRTRISESALSALLQGRVFGCEPTSEECL